MCHILVYFFAFVFFLIIFFAIVFFTVFFFGDAFFSIFWVHEQFILQEEILSVNRIDTTNAFLDSLWPKVGRKIGPESNELTDLEL